MIKALSFAAILAAGALIGAPAQAAEGQKCLRAAQCSGPMPFICVWCPKENKVGCAHWACLHHKCAIQTCPEYSK